MHTHCSAQHRVHVHSPDSIVQEDSCTHSQAAQHGVGACLRSGSKVPLSLDKDLSLSSGDSLLSVAVTVPAILCSLVPRESESSPVMQGPIRVWAP